MNITQEKRHTVLGAIMVVLLVVLAIFIMSGKKAPFQIEGPALQSFLPLPATEIADSFSLALDSAAAQARSDLSLQRMSEISLTRQIAFLNEQMAYATLSISMTQEAHSASIALTRSAAEIESDKLEHAATREAIMLLTQETESDLAREHEIFLAGQDRRKEIAHANISVIISGYILPVLIFAISLVALLAILYFVLRTVTSRNTATHVIEFVSAITGNWSPHSVAVVEQQDYAISQSDQDLLDLLFHASKINCFTYDKLAKSGYPHGEAKWTSLMQRLQYDGYVYKISLPGTAERWEPSKGRTPGEIYQIYSSSLSKLMPIPIG